MTRAGGADQEVKEEPLPASKGVRTIWVEPISGIEFVYLAAGSFLMGTPEA